MNENCELLPDQDKWVHRKAYRKNHRLNPSQLKDLIKKSKGKCALSGALMIFDKEHGTPKAGTAGCHPLYASVDHVSPSNQGYGYQLVCYALNDLKGSLPYKLFKELQNTSAWKHLMQQWKSQAENNHKDVDALKALLKD